MLYIELMPYPMCYAFYRSNDSQRLVMCHLIIKHLFQLLICEKLLVFYMFYDRSPNIFRFLVVQTKKLQYLNLDLTIFCEVSFLILYSVKVQDPTVLSCAMWYYWMFHLFISGPGVWKLTYCLLHYSYF